jgi:hypothetical protein
MFHGRQVDKMTPALVAEDLAVSGLLGKINKGTDFINSSTGQWLNMTTQDQWPAHVRKLRVLDWQRRLQSLQYQASLSSDSAGKEIGIFAKVHLVHSSGQGQYILNKGDIVKGYGEDAASIIGESLS